MIDRTILLATFFVLSIIGAGQAQSSGWTQVTTQDGSKPVARHEAAFVLIKNKSYLLGGRGIRPVSIYDHKKNTWTQGAKPPIEIHHFQPVVYRNKIYIIGALTGGYPGETPVENVIIYNPKKDAWTIGDPIPEDRRRGSTGNIIRKRKIYVSCGIKNGHIGDHKTWLDVYDPKKGTWQALPDAPRARDHFQAALADDRLYVLGGRLSMAPDATFNHPVGEIDVYNFLTNTWSTLDHPLPTLRAGNFVIKEDSEIWVIGGESGDQEMAHDEVEALHIERHTWRTLPSLLQGRHGTGVINYQGQIFIASGCGKRGGSPELQTMEKLILK